MDYPLQSLAETPYHVSSRPHVIIRIVHACAKTREIREVGDEELTVADEEANPIGAKLKAIY